MVAGALLGAAGFAVIARLDAASGFLEMLPGFTLVPFGMGLAVPAMTTTVLSSVDRNLGGTASGALNAARQVGGALGVAAFGALVAHGDFVAGLRAAAIISAALMVAAAAIAYGNPGRAGRAREPASVKAHTIAPAIASRENP